MDRAESMPDEASAGGKIQHIAVIMDGNGRWARERGLPRNAGHRAGAERVRDIVRASLDAGVKYLTLYTFSKENWKRPRSEVSGIMGLAELFFRKFFRELRNDGVYFTHLGDRQGLPESVLRVIDNIEADNAPEKKLHLNLAFNYSGRAEIVRAARSLCAAAAAGELEPEDINEESLSTRLFTAGMPDPDLLIRTGGEMRISNFLIWQVAYTELWVTDVLWPDFTREHLLKAIEDFLRRERRFGGVKK